jgi:sugar transferase (PEP-CTERM/EpsH1 system associated)
VKLLLVCPRLPFPLDKGDRLTVNRLVHYLGERHEVILATFLEPGQDPGWVRKLEGVCRSVQILPLRLWRAYANCALGLLSSREALQALYYRDGRLQAVIDRVIVEQQPDLVYAHTIRMGPYLRSVRGRPKILAMQISMALNYRRLMENERSPLRKLLYWVEHRRVRGYEVRLARSFDRCLLIGPRDLEEIEKSGSLSNVFFSPHGVDTESFHPAPMRARSPEIIFTGNMSYAPNADAAVYFAAAILPLIQREIRDARFLVVGTDPTRAVQRLSERPGITVTGKVENLVEYLHRAAVSVDPLRIGAGLQNKILEGMSAGLPMVVTSIANEGIGAEDGLNICVADQPEQFAQRVCELLQDPERADQIGRAARQFVLQCWTWEYHFQQLEQLIVELVSKAEKRR